MNDRGAATIAITFAAGLIATACASPTPTPTALPPTATTRPTVRFEPSWTPPATATPPSTSTDLPEPVTVSVSLREAEREVMSWLDPSRAPRIEWSRYVRRNELVARLASLGETMLADQWPATFEDVPLSRLDDDPLLVVLASTRGIETLAGPTIAVGQPLPVPLQPEMASPHRVQVLAGFNAVTGHRRIAMSWPAGEDSRLAETVLALPAAQVRVVPASRPSDTPRPTSPAEPTSAGTVPSPWPPSPTPTPVPASARLTRANLPEALRATFDAYPLVPGSSWTWRYTGTNAGISWMTQLVTETVEAAWLEGDTVVVRSRVESRPLMADARGEVSLASEPGPTDPPVNQPYSVLRFVTPQLVVAGRYPGLDVSLTGLVRTDARARVSRSGAVLSAFVGLIPSDHLGVDNDVADEPADVVTPAGTFRGCWLTSNWGGASHGAARWFCPGVGYVQYAYGDLATMHASNAVADLLRWRRGSLPER